MVKFSKPQPRTFHDVSIDFFRMPLAVKKNEPFNPMDISLLSPDSVGSKTHHFPT